MTEWPKVHDWKSCVLKGTEGSNPSPSALFGPRRAPSRIFVRGVSYDALRLAQGPLRDFMVPGDATAVNPARSGRKQR